MRKLTVKICTSGLLPAISIVAIVRIICMLTKFVLEGLDPSSLDEIPTGAGSNHLPKVTWFPSRTRTHISNSFETALLSLMMIIQGFVFEMRSGMNEVYHRFLS